MQVFVNGAELPESAFGYPLSQDSREDIFMATGGTSEQLAQMSQEMNIRMSAMGTTRTETGWTGWLTKDQVTNYESRTSTFRCNAVDMGGDPNPGTRKTCECEGSDGAPDFKCADESQPTSEGGRCVCTTRVRFGSNSDMGADVPDRYKTQFMQRMSGGDEWKARMAMAPENIAFPDPTNFSVPLEVFDSSNQWHDHRNYRRPLDGIAAGEHTFKSIASMSNGRASGWHGGWWEIVDQWGARIAGGEVDGLVTGTGDETTFTVEEGSGMPPPIVCSPGFFMQRADGQDGRPDDNACGGLGGCVDRDCSTTEECLSNGQTCDQECDDECRQAYDSRGCSSTASGVRCRDGGGMEEACQCRSGPPIVCADGFFFQRADGRDGRPDDNACGGLGGCVDMDCSTTEECMSIGQTCGQECDDACRRSWDSRGCRATPDGAVVCRPSVCSDRDESGGGQRNWRQPTPRLENAVCEVNDPDACTMDTDDQGRRVCEVDGIMLKVRTEFRAQDVMWVVDDGRKFQLDKSPIYIGGMAGIEDDNFFVGSIASIALSNTVFSDRDIECQYLHGQETLGQCAKPRSLVFSAPLTEDVEPNPPKQIVDSAENKVTLFGGAYLDRDFGVALDGDGDFITFEDKGFTSGREFSIGFWFTIRTECANPGRWEFLFSEAENPDAAFFREPEAALEIYFGCADPGDDDDDIGDVLRTYIQDSCGTTALFDIPTRRIRDEGAVTSEWTHYMLSVSPSSIITFLDGNQVQEWGGRYIVFKEVGFPRDWIQSDRNVAFPSPSSLTTPLCDFGISEVYSNRDVTDVPLDTLVTGTWYTISWEAGATGQFTLSSAAGRGRCANPSACNFVGATEGSCDPTRDDTSPTACRVSPDWPMCMPPADPADDPCVYTPAQDAQCVSDSADTECKIDDADVTTDPAGALPMDLGGRPAHSPSKPPMAPGCRLRTQGLGGTRPRRSPVRCSGASIRETQAGPPSHRSPARRPASPSWAGAATVPTTTTSWAEWPASPCRLAPSTRTRRDACSSLARSSWARATRI